MTRSIESTSAERAEGAERRSDQESVGWWAALGLTLYVLAGPAALLLVATLERILLPEGAVQSGTEALSIRNGSWPVVWGVIVLGGSLVAAPRLARGVRPTPIAWGIAALGLGLAGMTEYQIDEFVRRAYGRYDPEYVGLSLFGPMALVAVACAAWAAASLARTARRPLSALAGLAAAGLAVALVASAPGAADGVRPENLGIAVTFTADAFFAIGAFLLAAIAPGPEDGDGRPPEIDGRAP